MLRVREMASGQESPAGRSTPCGRGGREVLPIAPGGGTATPFEGGGGCWYDGNGRGNGAGACLDVISKGKPEDQRSNEHDRRLHRRWNNQRAVSYS